MDRIQIYCFILSYAVAFGLELWHLVRPRRVLRLLAQGFGAPGLVAHTLYLADKRPPLAWQFGWMMLLAWVLAIFYLLGSLHHRRVAWGVFVLPLVIALVGLGAVFGGPIGSAAPPRDDNLWGMLHGFLIFLATIGICVGFLASLMYLYQTHRLRAKLPPTKGIRLLSLERLEMMNRRAITLAFPLLTAGVLLGAGLMLHYPPYVWTDRRILSTMALWLTFALMIVLRFSYHLRARQMALLTILTFVLLVGCLTFSHPVGQGGPR
jgi:ABC-type transport system involved in cytochrome c biogenesis permease subunit